MKASQPQFEAWQDSEAVYIKLPRENILEGVYNVGDIDITDAEEFFKFVTENIVTIYDKRYRDLYLYALIDELVAQAATQGKGATWYDWEQDLT